MPAALAEIVTGASPLVGVTEAVLMVGRSLAVAPLPTKSIQFTFITEPVLPAFRATK